MKKHSIIKYFLVFACYWVLNNQLSAQVTAMAEVDKDTIQIGESLTLDISVSHPEDIEVEWPRLLDKIGDFEILSNSTVQTQKEAGNIIQNQELQITSFDEGYYAIPGFNFSYKEGNQKRRVQSKGILVTVETMEVDTSRGPEPIKDILSVSLTWRDYLGKILMAVGVLALAFILFLLYRRFAKTNQEEEVEEEVEQVAPEIIALEELNKLEKDKKWEKVTAKEYYSELTDILREYIEKRFDVAAMESTSDEIIEGMENTNIPQSLQGKLSTLLNLSDFVKFAKAHPTNDQHKQSLKDAFVFVQHSKNLGEKEGQKNENP